MAGRQGADGWAAIASGLRRADSLLTRNGQLALLATLAAGGLLSAALLYPWNERRPGAGPVVMPLAARPRGEALPSAPPPPVEGPGSYVEPSVPDLPIAPDPIEPPPAAPPAPPVRTRTVRMLVTAYCPCQACCGHHSDGRTASGRSVRTNSSRFVAADTRLLPFGTRVSVPGYYEAAPVSVLDRGGRIKGRRLDVFFLSHARAKQWGSRWLDVTVYE